MSHAEALSSVLSPLLPLIIIIIIIFKADEVPIFKVTQVSFEQ